MVKKLFFMLMLSFVFTSCSMIPTQSDSDATNTEESINNSDFSRLVD